MCHKAHLCLPPSKLHWHMEVHQPTEAESTAAWRETYVLAKLSRYKGLREIGRGQDGGRRGTSRSKRRVGGGQSLGQAGSER